MTETSVEEPPFSTVPITDEDETRLIALTHPDWRGLANACGIAASDMARFLRGEASLTGPNRAAIRNAAGR